MRKYLFIVLILLMGSAQAAQAADYMVFWYPGEAGSTQEAQPILDEFTDYIKTKIPKINLQARYFNTTEAGLNFIKGSKPKLGIVSYAAWESHKSQFPGAQVWLATNPLPSGKSMESYALVGKANAAAGPQTAYSSEPLTKDFIRNDLAFAQNVTPTQTSQVLYVMKKISSGEQKGVAILTPMEANVFKRMKAPWVDSLKVLATSKAVPTARVILFGTPSSEMEALKKVFLEIKDDPQAKEMLEELRLVGFSTH